MLLTPNFQSLIANPAVRRIMEITRAGGGEVRMVGGAVRDLLLGRAVGEIDFATNLPPEKMSELLAKAGLKAVPTGIEFGTITAVIDGKGYEITTLRHDIETDGRRAKVAFTDDWQADAARRDFTMNALYVDADGKLYDYFEGQKDLSAGLVRFIGNAQERIKEDVLRILRFFRFYAQVGREAMDTDGLAACRELAPLIPQLSVERIWREIVKLLAADNPAPSWQLLADAKILDGVLPETKNLARLQCLIAVEKKYEVPPSSLRRLAALLASEKILATAIAQKLKLSKREAASLEHLLALPALLIGKLDPVPFRRALYEYGVEAARDAALLCGAAQPDFDLEPVLAAAAEWTNPTFPVQGEDILKLGQKPGPEVGALLGAIEELWIASDFKLPRDECLAMASSLLSTAI